MTNTESKSIFQSSAAYWDAKVNDFDAIYSGVGWSKAYKSLSDLLRKDIFDRVAQTVVIANEFQKPISILDVGCGTGRLIEALKSTSHYVVGVDYSQKMLDKAQEILSEQGIQQNQYKLMLADVVNDWSPELDNYEKFEVVAMLGLVEYISNPVPLLQKMLRFAPDKIVVSFCRDRTLRTYLRMLRYKIQGLDCPLFFYTPQEIKAMGQDLGAKSTEIRTIGELYFTEFNF